MQLSPKTSNGKERSEEQLRLVQDLKGYNLMTGKGADAALKEILAAVAGQSEGVKL